MSSKQQQSDTKTAKKATMPKLGAKRPGGFVVVRVSSYYALTKKTAEGQKAKWRVELIDGHKIDGDSGHALYLQAQEYGRANGLGGKQRASKSSDSKSDDAAKTSASKTSASKSAAAKSSASKTTTKRAAAKTTASKTRKSSAAKKTATTKRTSKRAAASK